MRNPAPAPGALLVLLAMAAVALAGCASNDGATTPDGPTAPSRSPGEATPTSRVKEFHVDVTETGFKEQDGLDLTVSKGDEVKVILYHAEPYGDAHPIYFTCSERAATVTSTSGPAEMSFVADEAGTCSFYCTNHDCGPHDALQGGKLVVEE